MVVEQRRTARLSFLAGGSGCSSIWLEAVEGRVDEGCNFLLEGKGRGGGGLVGMKAGPAVVARVEQATEALRAELAVVELMEALGPQRRLGHDAAGGQLGQQLFEPVNCCRDALET